MRALGAALAFAYTASFVAACLGGCLAEVPAPHGCCQGEEGLKAAGNRTDCCTVTPGVSVKQGTSAPVGCEPLPPARESIFKPAVAYALAPTPAAASPPLILRI
jgi:hypothetical protein